MVASHIVRVLMLMAVISRLRPSSPTTVIMTVVGEDFRRRRFICESGSSPIDSTKGPEDDVGFAVALDRLDVCLAERDGGDLHRD